MDILFSLYKKSLTNVKLNNYIIFKNMSLLVFFNIYYNISDIIYVFFYNLNLGNIMI